MSKFNQAIKAISQLLRKLHLERPTPSIIETSDGYYEVRDAAGDLIDQLNCDDFTLEEVQEMYGVDSEDN